MTYTLDTFVHECRGRISAGGVPADFVTDLAPSIHRLLSGDQSFLKPKHFQSHSEHYARNAIYIADDDSMNLYALVWLPGQWTPIHDHGTWGVVGVSEGRLEERNFIRIDQHGADALEDIDLVRGGVILLAPGAVTSFVPNPDHIHITGNSDPQERVVSLHLYGSGMSGFHIYDRDTRTRHWIEVSHNES